MANPPRLVLLVLLALLSRGLAAEEERAEDPQAVVFLNRLSRRDGAPTKEGLDDLVVLSEVAQSDPWFAAAKAMTGGREREVVRFDPAAPDRAFRRLEKLAPGFVLVLIRPESLDVNFHFDFLERASRLDDDPFVDFAFGYLTGATPEEAVAFAEGIAKARKRKLPRTILEFGPTTSPYSLTSPTPHKWAEGFTVRRLGHPAGAKDVADSLPVAGETGVLAAWGHGMPDRVADGLTGRQLRESGRELYPALYFSGPCYCGVTGRWFGTEGGRIVEDRVAPEESFLLALIKARVTGAFAGLDPDRGETCHHELDHLLVTGEPLGLAAKSTYDDAVLAYRRERFVLPRYEPGKGRPFRDIHDQMISGSACRALFGDPRFRPYPKSGEDPFRVETKKTKDGRLVVWRGGEDLGRTWLPVDVCRASGSWTHRIRFTFELEPKEARKLEDFEVLSVTKDGKPLEGIYATAALESWGDSVRVHGLLVFPVDPKDRALWNGKEFEARFLLR